MTNDPGCHSERSRGIPLPNLPVTLRDPSTPKAFGAQNDESLPSSLPRVSSFGFRRCFYSNLAHTTYPSRLITIEYFLNRNATSRSIRHSQLRAGVFLLHRRIHLDLAHLRRQRQYLEFH